MIPLRKMKNMECLHPFFYQIILSWRIGRESIRLPRRCAPRNDNLSKKILGSPIRRGLSDLSNFYNVIASPERAWQSLKTN